MSADLTDSMLTRAVDAIQIDPLAHIRTDYLQLKAHFKMVFDDGNALLRKAQQKHSEAQAVLDEADQIHQQMTLLERLHPELEEL